MSDQLVEARAAVSAGHWARAKALFAQARRRSGLGAADLHALSDVSWWLGDIPDAIADAAAAHREFLREGNTRRAAMAALDCAGLQLLRGDWAEGSVWLSNAGRLLDGDRDCAEYGYLCFFQQVQPALDSAGLQEALRLVDGVRELARRHGDRDLAALATLAEGGARIRHGQVAAGLNLLDQAMASVTAGELGPVWAGQIHCQVITSCHELLDLRRMTMWTEHLDAWCSGFEPAVVYRSVCRVHRAQLMCMRGDWSRAEDEAASAEADVRELVVDVAAQAASAVGDARRLRGDLAHAEHAYLDAHQLGTDPQPGMALLRLAEGRTDAALASIRAALTAESRSALHRAPLCFAATEIALAAQAPDVARKAADELAETARGWGSSGLSAMAAHATGAVLLDDGHPDEALPVLRQACAAWRGLDVPYECAKVRRLLSRAYALLGDDDASARERDEADRVVGRLQARARRARSEPPDGLTRREVEVLGMVAQGWSNRRIADALVLSEKTVARHLSNIYAKLDLPSRTAAAAYAHRQGLVSGDG